MFNPFNSDGYNKYGLVLFVFFKKKGIASKRISSDKASNLPKRDVRFILLK